MEIEWKWNWSQTEKKKYDAVGFPDIDDVAGESLFVSYEVQFREKRERINKSDTLFKMNLSDCWIDNDVGPFAQWSHKCLIPRCIIGSCSRPLLQVILMLSIYISCLSLAINYKHIFQFIDGAAEAGERGEDGQWRASSQKPTCSCCKFIKL